MMLRHVLATLVVIAVLAPLAPAATPAPDPRFKVPRSQLLTMVKSVGVMPVSVPDLVPDSDSVARRIEAEVLARMTPAGFELVPSEAMREIQDRAKTALGGLYDPMTGRANNDKLRAYREYVTNEYRHDHPVDAWLRLRVVERLAPTINGTATWDGVSDSSTGHTGFSGFMVSGAAAGHLPVLSLSVQLTAADGRVLYESSGGLQVLSYVKGFAGNIEILRVDPKFIMHDPARDERALGIALDPLARGEQAKAQAEPPVAPTATTETTAVGLLSRDELIARFHRLGLAPLEIGAIGQHDQAQARYAELLKSRLTKLGFEVVPADDYATRWEDELKSAGGFYDPFTGRADDTKRRALRARVVGAMRDLHAVDAVVVPAIEARNAHYHDDYATWDGGKELTTATKSGLGALFSPSHYGYVQALSLRLRFVDGDGAYLYEGLGGIQLAEHLEGQRHVPVPQSDLFVDPAKDEQAVEVALGGLERPSAKRPSPR
jgi:hypothetical protein